MNTKSIGHVAKPGIIGVHYFLNPIFMKEGISKDNVGSFFSTYINVTFVLKIALIGLFFQDGNWIFFMKNDGDTI